MALGSEQYSSSSHILEETHKLVHELHTHIFELELQNKDLCLAQLSLKEPRRKYTDLFTLTPVAYLAVDDAGLIEECNLTATAILGITRQQMLRLFIYAIHSE